MNLNINKGFESMIPKEKPKPKEPTFHNNISFTIFGKRVTLIFELK